MALWGYRSPTTYIQRNHIPHSMDMPLVSRYTAITRNAELSARQNRGLSANSSRSRRELVDMWVSSFWESKRHCWYRVAGTQTDRDPRSKTPWAASTLSQGYKDERGSRPILSQSFDLTSYNVIVPPRERRAPLSPLAVWPGKVLLRTSNQEIIRGLKLGVFRQRGWYCWNLCY